MTVLKALSCLNCCCYFQFTHLDTDTLNIKTTLNIIQLLLFLLVTKLGTVREEVELVDLSNRGKRTRHFYCAIMQALVTMLLVSCLFFPTTR